MTTKQEKLDLIDEYAEKIAPYLELAKRAYGSRDQVTPAHIASREYTRLLVEFHEKGGSLIGLSARLGVAYSGVRRRVFTSNVPSVKSTRKQKSKIDQAMMDHATERVKQARESGTSEYHAQLYEEFISGIPMNLLARSLGISNAGPLYYGVQRHYKKLIESRL